jgi:hypothetical protein
MSPAKRHRRRRFITAAVDVLDRRIIDVFEGRNAADLQAWLGSQPIEWVRGIKRGVGRSARGLPLGGHHLRAPRPGDDHDQAFVEKGTHSRDLRSD